jgi:hypothetical protein
MEVNNRTSDERLEVIKQSPRQASVDDVEWLCDEIERLRAELDHRAVEQEEINDEAFSGGIKGVK